VEDIQGRTRVLASAEIIDLRAARERRKAIKTAPAAAPIGATIAWVPVWFFAPIWLCMPAQAGETRDG
jgi:hypothetical protein